MTDCFAVAKWTPEAASTWLGRTVTHIEFKPLAGGASCVTNIMTVTFEGEEAAPVQYVLKVQQAANGLGLSREAHFYSDVWAFDEANSAFPPATRRQLAPHLAKCHFARGDQVPGPTPPGIPVDRKAIVLDFVAGSVDSGYFHGRHSPHNVTQFADEAALTARVQPWLDRGVTQAKVATQAARLAAVFHAPWFGRPLAELVADPRLASARARDWLEAVLADAAAPPPTWQSAHEFSHGVWTQELERAAVAGERPFGFSPLVEEVVRASLAKTTWDDYKQRARAAPLGLAFGDFHPSNQLVGRDLLGGAGGAGASAVGGGMPHLTLLDFEMFGFGEPLQDVGQYLLSHSRPEVIFALEHDFVRTYLAELTEQLRLCGNRAGVEWLQRAAAGAADDDSAGAAARHAYFFAQQVEAGLGRWLWLLPILSLYFKTAHSFFHDQVDAYLVHHNITGDNAPAMRI